MELAGTAFRGVCDDELAPDRLIVRRVKESKCPAGRRRLRGGRYPAEGPDAKDGQPQEISPVSDHIYKMIELVGFSDTSIENAAKAAVAQAAIDEKNMRWLEVKEIRGQIESGRIAHWQVRISIGAAQET